VKSKSSNGILLVNKPVALSTFDLIRKFKKESGFTGKIGHAGTLDVFAHGLIVLLFGDATKRFDDLQEMNKEYLAQVRLGYSTKTLDIEGDFVGSEIADKSAGSDIEKVLPNFLGNQNQQTPVYSATKFSGKPMYKLARRGEFPRLARTISVEAIELLAYKYPLVNLRIVCSSGTYVRQLTYDIFKSLRHESFLFGLQRVKIGEYTLDKAIDMADFADGWKSRVLV
jgi:tRNA pseudouridine55 synthase